MAALTLRDRDPGGVFFCLRTAGVAAARVCARCGTRDRAVRGIFIETCSSLSVPFHFAVKLLGPVHCTDASGRSLAGCAPGWPAISIRSTPTSGRVLCHWQAAPRSESAYQRRAAAGRRQRAHACAHTPAHAPAPALTHAHTHAHAHAPTHAHAHALALAIALALAYNRCPGSLVLCGDSCVLLSSHAHAECEVCERQQELLHPHLAAGRLW